MLTIWLVAIPDRSRMPELQPDLETEAVHAVERMTMYAAEVTFFGKIASLDTVHRPRPAEVEPAWPSPRPSSDVWAMHGDLVSFTI